MNEKSNTSGYQLGRLVKVGDIVGLVHDNSLPEGAITRALEYSNYGFAFGTISKDGLLHDKLDKKNKKKFVTLKRDEKGNPILDGLEKDMLYVLDPSPSPIDIVDGITTVAEVKRRLKAMGATHFTDPEMLSYVREQSPNQFRVSFLERCKESLMRIAENHIKGKQLQRQLPPR